MADRPGDKGEPGFDWLYGKNRRSDDEATQAIQQQPRHDQTRQIPVQERRQQGAYAPPREPARPTPPPVAPPPGAPHRARGGMVRRPRFWLRVVIALLVLWIVYLIAVPLWAWQKVDKVDF